MEETAPSHVAPDALPVGMVQEEAEVLQNQRIAPDHYRMRLESRRAARRARPGQFVHVLCIGKTGRTGKAGSAKSDFPFFLVPPLLRRPFSLFDADPSRGTVEIIYKVVGVGTAALARAKAGERVDFLGPLGSPFQIPAGIRQAWLVGGGVGIPPLYFLANWLKGVEVKVFLGARTKGWVLCASDFRRLGVAVKVATDDGSLGYRGSVVDLLKSNLSSPRKRGSDSPFRGNDEGMLYLCGPTPMMAAASALARRMGIPAQVSLEERMGCAMGVCMGCVVEVTTEPANSNARFQRVCTEGPVFPAEAVAWR